MSNNITWNEFIQVVDNLKDMSYTMTTTPNYSIIHPKIWNGYWYVERTNHFLRWLGRKLKNKYIYWLGFQIRWELGLKDWPEFAGYRVDEITDIGDLV